MESISFYLIVTYNKSQKEIWAHSSNLFTGAINERVQGVYSFFDLQSSNDSLLIENARLHETIINYRIQSTDNSFQRFELQDSVLDYQLIPSRICSKTLHLRNNFITLCKGTDDGIYPGMGVISNNGVIGIVKTASSGYATVIMIHNSQSNIGAKVKSKNYSGNLIWNFDDTQILSLTNIPKHAELSVGDTIVTSGYSISFPAEVPIGKIMDFKIEGGSNNYIINVRLDYDLSKTEFVYVVDFEDKKEKAALIKVENE